MRLTPPDAVPSNPLPTTFGRLLPLVQDAVGYRSRLHHLLGDPEMAVPIAAAPVPVGRALRPLCRMPGLPPPPTPISAQPGR